MTAGQPVAAAGTRTASLQDIDISDELLARPARTLNRKREIAAIYALAGAISQSSACAFKRLSIIAMELCGAGSAGVSLLEAADSGDIFRWRGLAGEIESYEGGSTPRSWSPCGESLKAGKARLYSYPARYFTYLQELALPLVEALVIPIYLDVSPVGTIWIVSHTPERLFDAEHVRIMTGLGSFAASAVQVKRTAGGGTVREADRSSGVDEAPPPEFPSASRFEREMVWGEYVRRIANGDELALEALFQETHALVFAIALRIISFHSDAEEIAADVFARVWTSAASYDPRRGDAGAWLIGMARNAAIDRLRALAARHRCEAALASRRDAENPEFAMIDFSRTDSRLREALQTLPPEQRRAIELFYLSGLSVAQIAAQLGHPAGTVKTRLRTGLMKLRRLYAAIEAPVREHSKMPTLRN